MMLVLSMFMIQCVAVSWRVNGRQGAVAIERLGLSKVVALYVVGVRSTRCAYLDTQVDVVEPYLWQKKIICHCYIFILEILLCIIYHVL